MTLSFIFLMEIIGTISFAASGAIVAIRKKMDIFGVIILAITTASGGGIIRDTLIGNIPPKLFNFPVYLLFSTISAIVIFIFFNIRPEKIADKSKDKPLYTDIMFWCDSLGLAAFTVNGVSVGMSTKWNTNIYLIIFVGVITGVGGGVLRDIMANEIPYIFVKHIYACASLAGALAAYFLWDYIGTNKSILAGFILTMIIRILAAHYRWNLPNVTDK